MLDKFAEPNRIKLDETIRKLRKVEIRDAEVPIVIEKVMTNT